VRFYKAYAASNIPEAKNRVGLLDGSLNVLTYIDITPDILASHIKGFEK